MLAVHFWGMRYEVSTPFVHSAIPPEELDKHPHQWEKPANLCRCQDFSTSLHKGQQSSRREARLLFAPALPPWSEPNWLWEWSVALSGTALLQCTGTQKQLPRLLTVVMRDHRARDMSRHSGKVLPEAPHLTSFPFWISSLPGWQAV